MNRDVKSHITETPQKAKFTQTQTMIINSLFEILLHGWQFFFYLNYKRYAIFRKHPQFRKIKHVEGVLKPRKSST